MAGGIRFRMTIIMVVEVLLFTFGKVAGNTPVSVWLSAGYTSSGERAFVLQEKFFTGRNVKDMYLIYHSGQGEWKQPVRREKDGSLVALIPEGWEHAYCFLQIVEQDGNVWTIPDVPGGEPPIRVDEFFAQQELQVEFISPDENAQVLQEDVTIVISYLGIKERIDPERIKVYIDQLDLTPHVQFYPDFLQYTPPRLREGWHEVKVVFYDREGQLLGEKKYRFEVVTSQSSRSGSFARTKNYQGRFFINNRYESYLDNAFSEDYFYTGLNAAGKQKSLEWKVNLLVSNQEKKDRQPVNQYGAQLGFVPGPDLYFKIAAGDGFPYYDDLFFFGVRNRGVQADIRLKFFSFQFLRGMIQREIEGTADVNGNILVNGVYRRNVTGFMPAFHITDHSTTRLYYLHFKDDANSVDYGYNPQENGVFGIAQQFRFNNNRLQASFQFAGSVFNRNIEGGNIPFDTLKNVLTDLDDSDKKMYDLAKKFITVNENLLLSVPYAWKGQLYLNYFRNRLTVQYQYIQESFQTMGNPYLLRDIKGLTLRDQIQLMPGKVFMTLQYENLVTNFSDEQQNETKINRFGAMVSFYPGTNYPSLSFGINMDSRDNHTVYDPNSFLYAENNRNTSLQFATSYNFFTGEYKNLVNFSFTSYLKEDKINEIANTTGQNFNGSVRTLWSANFYTQLQMMINNNELGKNDPFFGSRLKSNSFAFLTSYKPAFGSGKSEQEITFQVMNYSSEYEAASSITNINKLSFMASWYLGLENKGRFYLNSRMVRYSKDITGTDFLFGAGYERNF